MAVALHPSCSAAAVCTPTRSSTTLQILLLHSAGRVPYLPRLSSAAVPVQSSPRATYRGGCPCLYPPWPWKAAAGPTPLVGILHTLLRPCRPNRPPPRRRGRRHTGPSPSQRKDPCPSRRSWLQDAPSQARSPAVLPSQWEASPPRLCLRPCRPCRPCLPCPSPLRPAAGAFPQLPRRPLPLRPPGALLAAASAAGAAWSPGVATEGRCQVAIRYGKRPEPASPRASPPWAWLLLPWELAWELAGEPSSVGWAARRRHPAPRAVGKLASCPPQWLQQPLLAWQTPPG
mmetsp:Transcript_65136/g.174650  ORF Transcript_65136/g.174650 Transcript_65136/m.174650 type:complete len:287 (-) Transcript_65136:1530-2390(-)